jgi:hypothetical protein
LCPETEKRDGEKSSLSRCKESASVLIFAPLFIIILLRNGIWGLTAISPLFFIPPPKFRIRSLPFFRFPNVYGQQTIKGERTPSPIRLTALCSLRAEPQGETNIRTLWNSPLQVTNRGFPVIPILVKTP